MKRYLQCAEQQSLRTNVTKYETLFTMRGATEVTLQHHQILSLPRKSTLMIDPRHKWNVICNARSNRGFPPASPNIAPATKNDSHDCSSSHMKLYLQCAEQVRSVQTCHTHNSYRRIFPLVCIYFTFRNFRHRLVRHYWYSRCVSPDSETHEFLAPAPLLPAPGKHLQVSEHFLRFSPAHLDASLWWLSRDAGCELFRILHLCRDEGTTVGSHFDTELNLRGWRQL